MVKARISLEDMRVLAFPIIPCQVITGNYDVGDIQALEKEIIPCQVITGNYDSVSLLLYNSGLYHAK